MTEKFKQIIKEEVGKLPKEAQEVVNNSRWAEITEEIGRKYNLTEYSINDLQAEVLIIIVGADEPMRLSLNLEKHMSLKHDLAEKIEEEIFQKIFAPVKRSLANVVKDKMKDKTASWQQNIDFIMSGGDYSAFVGNTSISSRETTDKLLGSSNILETKRKLIE